MARVRTVHNKPDLTGFTLIEVTFAVLILSVSLVTVLGLQSSILQRSIRDRNSQQAMLYAREILSAIEANLEAQKEIELGEHSGPAQDVAGEFLPLPPSETQSTPPFMARVTISKWPIPGSEEDLVRKIDVVVYWSSSPLDQISAVYFVPAPVAGDQS